MSETALEATPNPTPGKQKKQRPKIKGLQIFPVKIGGVDYWRVATPQVNNKRTIKTFRKERDAHGFYDQQYDLVKIAGRNGFGLSERQKVDAQAALEVLQPFGVTLLEGSKTGVIPETVVC